MNYTPAATSPGTPGSLGGMERQERQYDLSAQVTWKTYESEDDLSQNYVFENIGMLDTLDCSQRGEAMVHVTPFGLMLQAMEKGVESLFFQLYAISRFQTVGTVFVFEAVNHDTGFLDIHILEGSLITAKGLEAGLTVAIQLKLNGLQQKIEPSAFQQQQAEYSDRLNITRPMSTQNYNRKTSFFSEPATPPQKAGMIDMVTQAFQDLGSIFKPSRRRSSGASHRSRQISI